MQTSASGQQQVIEATGITVEVDGARLLAGVDLSVGRGAFIGLIGPNGAGKSTLLRTLARLRNATSGTLLIEGVDAKRAGAAATARALAFVSQHAPDTHGFSAFEVVLTGRHPHLGRFAIEGAADREIAIGALDRTGTLQFAPRDAGSLSGGERQRVFIARGLAQQPRILLLDEPTASLDIRHQFGVMELARELVEEGVTVIAAIHDLGMAARYCSRLVLLDHGKVVADGSPDAVLTPENLASVFQVEATVFRDPVRGRLMISFEPRAASPAAQAAAPQASGATTH